MNKDGNDNYMLVQNWLFHYYCLRMALYFGSKLTLSLLLSYDGLVFWFKADCFVIIVSWWPWMLVQNWLFHCYCLMMALHFGSKLGDSLLLSYEGLVFWFKADCFIIIVLRWPVFWFTADCFIIIVLRWLCILVQSWLFHCYCLTMALYFGSKLTVALLLSDDGLVFWFSADCFIIIFWRWLCILVQSWLFHWSCLTMAFYTI